MNRTKTCVHILAIITLFACSQNLLAMFKTPEDHGLKIEKNTKAPNAPEILIPGSIKVFTVPILNTSSDETIYHEKTILLDKDILACACNRDIFVVNFKTGVCLKKLSSDYPVTSLVKITENKFASGDVDGWIEIWDLTKEKECIKIIQEHYDPKKPSNERPIYNLLTLNETSIASSDFGGTIIVLDLTQPEGKECVKKFNTKGLAGAKLARIPGSEQIIAGGIAGGVVSLDTKKTTDTEPLFCYKIDFFINDILSITNKKYIVGLARGILFILDVESETFTEIDPENLSLKKASIFGGTYILKLPDNKNIVSCASEGVINVWQPEKSSYSWIQEIDFFTLLKKKDDYIVLFTYEEKEGKLIATTRKGLVITCQCNVKGSKDDKDIKII